jgi:agmatinase
LRILDYKSTDHNFLGIPSDFSEFEKSKFVILPVPYEQTTTYQKGTKKGPEAIIHASHEIETFDEELKFEPYRTGICTLKLLEINSVEPTVMLEKVRQATQQLISKEKKVVMLGGEHTISIGVVKAFKEKYPGLSVLQMDAHADLRDSYQENKFSHACVMRRIAEICPFVGIGVRNLSVEEHDFVQENKADIFFSHEMKDNRRWKEQVLEHLGSDVYLTLDLDVLDPSIMPAVGTPEPGGLLWYETLEFLKELIEEKNIVGCDMVELCPIPGMVAPDFLAAKLVYKIIGYMANKERN